MKVCNVIPTGDCRFNCFLLPKQGAKSSTASQFPLNIVYDLKIVCPRLDRYWYFDHAKKAKSRQMARESELTALNSRNHAAKRGDQSKPHSNQPDNADPGANRRMSTTTGDGLHTRNFEWERRESNYREEEFGLELGVV